MKICTRCKSEKYESEFNKNRAKRDGLSTECKSCVKAVSTAYYETHKEKWDGYEEKKRTVDPEGFVTRNREAQATYRANPSNTIRLRYLWTRYGVTVERYQEMWDQQGGLCAVCRDPDRGKYRRLHVDHDHVDGYDDMPPEQKGQYVRALLCFSCNSGLGHFVDRGDWLRAAADYVEAHRSAVSPNEDVNKTGNEGLEMSIGEQGND